MLTKEQVSTLQILLSKQDPEQVQMILTHQRFDDTVVFLKTTTTQFKIKPDGTATVRFEQEVQL